MPKLLIILLLFFSLPGISQKKITWDSLKDVRFTDEYSKEVDAYFYYPHFGPSVKALAGKEIIIEGYMLVINRKIEARSTSIFLTIFGRCFDRFC